MAAAQPLSLQLLLFSGLTFFLCFLDKCAAGDFCPEGSLHFFSAAFGGTGFAAGTWTLGKEAGSGTQLGSCWQHEAPVPCKQMLWPCHRYL